MITREKILAMPKVELHLHLDGALRADTVMDLAIEHGIELPTDDLDELENYLRVSEDCQSLGEYLEKFEFPLAVLQTRDALERVAYELCESAAAENIRYFEVRFAPHLHTREGLSLDEIVLGVLDGLNEGQIEFDLKVGLILCAMRHQPVAMNLEIADLAARFKDKGVVAVDLAGDEANFPARDHLEVFRRAKATGLHITIHAGEASGADTVAEAINLGAERIGHGVRAYEDPTVLTQVKEAEVLLEVCPKSNRHTKAVPDVRNHPVKSYYDQGILVNINTDNPTVSNTSLSDEYLLVVRELGFNFEDLKQMVIYAAESAFLSEYEKQQLVRMIKKELSNLE